MTDPELIPIYGCPRESQAHAIEGSPGAKWGALWPEYLVACPGCSVEYVWCGAHYESGAHFYCEGCCGWPWCSCEQRHAGPCVRRRGGA